MTTKAVARLVSVVIPAYNAERTLRATVESVLAQTYRPIEIVIIDDGSRDSTAAVARSMGESARLVTQENAGAAAARSRGIVEANGEFLAFLDADDLWLPDKLARQVAYFDANPAVGALQTGARLVDDSLRTLEERACTVGGDLLWETLQFQNVPALMSTLMLRRSCLDRIGGFDACLEILEDWDMAIRASRHCAMASLPDPLVLYRVHPGNRSRNVDIHVAPGLLVLKRLFAEADLPDRIRRNRHRVYGALYRMLAGGYYRAGRRVEFARWALRALAVDPCQINYMLALPLRKLARWRNAR